MANHGEPGDGDDLRDIAASLTVPELRWELGRHPFNLDSRRYYMKKAEIIRYVETEDPEVRATILAVAQKRLDDVHERQRRARSESSVRRRFLSATEGRSFVVRQTARFENRYPDQLSGRRSHTIFAVEDSDTGERLTVTPSTARLLTEAGRPVGYEQFAGTKGRAAHDAGELTIDDLLSGLTKEPLVKQKKGRGEPTPTS